MKEIQGQNPGLLGATQVQALSIDDSPMSIRTQSLKLLKPWLRNESGSRKWSRSSSANCGCPATKAGETRISGDVDIDALRALLEEHLARLVKQPDADVAAAQYSALAILGLLSSGWTARLESTNDILPIMSFRERLEPGSGQSCMDTD